MEIYTDTREGYVYVLGVQDIELPVCKIGRSSRDPAIRCAEINKSSTGDFRWEVRHQIAVSDCQKFESLIHAKLLPLRQRRREFFNLWPDDAIVAVQSLLKSEPDLKAIATADMPQVPTMPPKPRQPRSTDRSDRDIVYAHLLDGFTELLGVKGHPFGQLNKPTFGISDGHEGVQWNLVIHPKNDKARLGVNLEGKEYRNWPISKLIQSELEAPTLPTLAQQLRDAEGITLRFARDAWQVSARPAIVEEFLGGREYPLSQLTDDLWHSILTDAIGCLDRDRRYRGRAQQAVTLIRKAGPDSESRTMSVSPHLTIWTSVDPSRDSNDELSSAIDRLRPVHEWASRVSGE